MMDRNAPLNVVLFIFIVISIAMKTSTAKPRDANPSFSKSQPTAFYRLVERAGYVAKGYEVVTEDGYLLYMYRIPGGPKSPISSGKSPVLLIHGLLGSSDSWVLQGATYDFAYLLVDNGYDVWLTNARGNYYGKRHRNITIEDSKFWEFSWHEVGIYDIAASLDLALAETGMTKVSVVAYSLGSTALYALLSMKPEYNEKIHASVIFGSIAIFTHDIPGVILNAFLTYADEIEAIFKFFGKYELLSRDEDSYSITDVCRYDLMKAICQELAFRSFGITHDNGYGELLIPETKSHLHQGTSTQSMIHLKQIVLSRKFNLFDYEPETNFKRYGSCVPPEYPLEKITSPMVLYYGPGDAYTTKEDVAALVMRIPRAVSREVPDPNFGHRDFMTSRTAKELLYDSVLRVFDRYRRV